MINARSKPNPTRPSWEKEKLEAGLRLGGGESFESVPQKLPAAMASSSKLSRGQIASAQINGDYAIKPESSQPQLDTSNWPLLLKNYDKLLVRSAHFVPIVAGCNPLKRDITSYVKYVLPRFMCLPAS